MQIEDIVKYRGLIKIAYYLISLACVALFGWAVYDTCIIVDCPLMLRICIYLVLTVLLIAIILFVNKRSGRKKLLAHTLLLQVAPLAISITMFCLMSDEELSLSPTPGEYKPLTGKVRTYERAFNDMQDKQKVAAEMNGLPPFESRSDVEDKYTRLRMTGKLVKISTNSKYIVRELTSSSPYVVPKVERLLDDIATRFQAKTQSKARFAVTSVLRTKEDVAKLRKTNVNASTNSCHCNATTIDISYVRFELDDENLRDNYQLRLALAQTLHELRKEGRCYVKIERKQYCYHITVR